MLHPDVITAAGYFQFPACLFHRGSLTAQRPDAAVLFLYGPDSMPTDFFKTSMTSSFSPSCLRNARTSASNSRIRCCSRFRRLIRPISTPQAFSQLRSVSIQIPNSLATSVGCRPCSVTSRTAPALKASSYRGGGVPFFTFFCSIFFAPFLSSLRLFFLSVNSGMGAALFHGESG